MLPTRFSDYCSKIPLLNEVTEWSLLRKWGGSEMAGEAEIYRNLVHPLQIKALTPFQWKVFSCRGNTAPFLISLPIVQPFPFVLVGSCQI